LQRLYPEWATTPRKPNRIHRLLDICRGNFREQETGYCVRNLLRIILLSRGDLAGVDLKLLDLRKVNLANVALVRRGTQPLHAQLFGAKATRKTFTGDNTPLPVAFTRVSPDGERVLFASKTGEVQEWDLTSSTCIFADQVKVEQEHLTQENAAAFPYHYLADLQDIRYHADGSLLFLRYAEGIYTWNPGQDPFLRTLSDPPSFEVLTAPPGTADAKTLKKIVRIQPLQGVYLQGCPLETLHPDSLLGEEDVKILRKHGAVFTDKDAQLRRRFPR
jgi:WD40 repeat protein